MRINDEPHLVHPNIAREGLVISILPQGAAYDGITVSENLLIWSIGAAKEALRTLLDEAHPRMSAYVRMASGPYVGVWIMTVRPHETIANIADATDSSTFRRVPANTNVFLETILDHVTLTGIR